MAFSKKKDFAKVKILEAANELLKKQDLNPIQISMVTENYVWGSNAVVANQGMLLAIAHALTKDRRFLVGGQRQLDYLLGKNAFGRSFITGYGHMPPKFPHHRLSVSDGIDEPIPGFVVGGPNKGQQDLRNCPQYSSDLPALSWTDETCSYASNEIAINWNAPVAFLVAYLDSKKADLKK